MDSAFAHSRPFAASSSTNPQNTTSTRQALGSKPTPVDLPALQNASHVLLEQLSKDAQIIPDIGDALTACEYLPFRPWCGLAHSLVPAGSQASGSYSIFADDTRLPFQKRKFTGIPDGLFQYYDSKFYCVLIVRADK